MSDTQFCKFKVKCNDCEAVFTEVYPNGLDGGESHSDVQDPKPCDCESQYTLIEAVNADAQEPMPLEWEEYNPLQHEITIAGMTLVVTRCVDITDESKVADEWHFSYAFFGTLNLRTTDLEQAKTRALQRAFDLLGKRKEQIESSMSDIEKLLR